MLTISENVGAWAGPAQFDEFDGEAVAYAGLALPSDGAEAAAPVLVLRATTPPPPQCTAEAESPPECKYRSLGEMLGEMLAPQVWVEPSDVDWSSEILTAKKLLCQLSVLVHRP